MRYLFLILFYITSGLLYILHAQEAAFKNYIVEDGLPSSEVYHVLQDSKGYIWFATNIGISRFDGKTFKNFDVQNGLPENTVFEVYEDAKKRLWFIGFPFQLSYYENDTIIPYKYNQKLHDLAGSGLIPVKKSFMVDRDDNIVFSFVNDGRIFRMDKYGKNTILNRVPDSSVFVAISKIDGKSFVAQSYSGFDSKYIKLTYKSGNTNKVFKIVRHPGKFPFGNYLTALTEEEEILFAYNNAITIIKQDGTYNQIKTTSRVFWINYSGNGILWVGTELTGIEKYNIRQSLVKPDDAYLSGKSISSSLEDREGGLWFTSLSEGVFYLASKAFYSFSAKDGFSGTHAYSIDYHKGKLYIGSDQTNVQVLENGRISRLSIGNDDNTVNVIKSFNDRTLWIGARSHLFTISGSRISSYKNNHPRAEKRIHDGNFVFGVKCIYPLGDNFALIGQMRSLSIVKDGNTIYDSFLDNGLRLRVEAIEKLNDSSYLLGTFNGLWKFKNRQFEFLGNVSPLLRRRILSIVKLDGAEEYVLGTKGSGLLIKTRDTIIQIATSQGLSSNSVTSVIRLGDTLLAATNNGLNILRISQVKENRGHIIILKKEHGLISNEINQLKTDGKRIFIAAKGGVTIFDPSRYTAFKEPSPVYIEKFSTNKENRSLKKHYVLDHDQNFISISFTGINFRDGNNLLYKYRLLGLSREWAATNNQEAEYAFLPPGEYRFEVVAVNSEGIVSNKPAFVSFKISPPLWKTWWFIIITMSLIVLLFITILKVRLRRLKTEHEIQNDIIKYRQQALIRQMDPHFVFNTLNSIQSFIIKNDSISSSFYLNKFSKLIRIILNNSQKHNIRVKEDIDALNLYLELECLRFPEKFVYSITSSEEIDINSFYIPAFIVQPFIENAIWHGIINLKKPGLIKVHYALDENIIVCTIEDNGIGRQQAKKMASDLHGHKESMGISNVVTRLNLLSINQERKLGVIFTDLYSTDGTPAGTRVTVEMPIFYSQN